MVTDCSEQNCNQLAIQAQAGCRDAFSDLTRYFRPRLIAILESRYGNSASDAEDVAQEALTKAFLNIQRFDPQYSFSTWLFTIAIRLSCDQHRSQNREKQNREAWSEFARANHAPEITHHESLFMEQDSIPADTIWDVAKDALSSLQFEAMWLRYGEGKPVREVALIMGKTSIGVRVLLHRARATLQRKCALQSQGNKS